MSEKEKVTINIIINFIQPKDDFTKYLESVGIVDNLIEVINNLYDETDKPKYPTEYIKANLKSSSAGENEVIAQNNKLRTENRQLKQKIADLEKGIERLKKEIEEKQEKQEQ